jgi:hypothetical protein
MSDVLSEVADYFDEVARAEKAGPLGRVAAMARTRDKGFVREDYHDPQPQTFAIFGEDDKPMACRYCGRSDQWYFEGEFYELKDFSVPVCTGGNWVCDHTQDPDHGTEYVPMQVRHEVKESAVWHFEPIDTGETHGTE